VAAKAQYAHRVQCNIEKLIYGGDGLARIPASGDERRGKTVFVPYVLPGELVEASIVEERKGFARAELTEVLRPATERVTPPCPHFGRCGGCSYQHATYAAQLELKRGILRETVLRGSKIELPEITVHAAEPWGFRNRTRIKIEITPEFALGYYRNKSHELEKVRECPISSPLINRAIAVCWEMAQDFAAYPVLREVQFFANHDDSSLLVELFVHHTAKPESLAELAGLMRKRMAEIAGIAIFSGVAPAGELEDGSLEASRQMQRAGAQVVGASHLMYKVNAQEYQVSAGSFFQTNRFLVPKLVELVTAGRSGRAAMDLFAGAGLFSLPLARNFTRVVAVEIAPYSYSDLLANAPMPQIQKVQSATEEYLSSARGSWDLVVVDPPRAGLGERTAKALAALRTPRITYVSCDPATLARDLNPLLADGFKVEEAHLVDLFPQTYHLESVLHLAR